MTPRQQITARAIQQKGRTRVVNLADGRMVQCPRNWRLTLTPGRPVRLLARLRADGACWVAPEQSL